jgi:hypothetical protein
VGSVRLEVEEQGRGETRNAAQTKQVTCEERNKKKPVHLLRIVFFDG